MKTFFLSLLKFWAGKRSDSEWRNFSFGLHYSQISRPTPFKNPAYAIEYTALYFVSELEQMAYIFSVLVFFAFMLQRFTNSHVSLIMIKLFRGWEFFSNAARSSLYDEQHSLLLLMSFVSRKLLLHQFSNSKH